MKFIITVDTEADNQWKKGANLSLRNISCLPRFEECIQSHGFKATYLITQEVAEDAAAAAMLRKWSEGGNAEVGSHLHPWSSPPFENENEREGRAFPSSLSIDRLRAKLEALTHAVSQAIGQKPESFRAGRFGIDERVLSELARLGYIADASVTPGINWQKITKAREMLAPDFSREGREPSVRSYEDGSITELPMTIVPVGLFRRPRWCRIFPETTLSDLVKVYKKARKLKLPYLQFLIHSSELLPGGSPYSKTEEQVEHIYALLNEFLGYLRKENVEPATLSSFVKSRKS